MTIAPFVVFSLPRSRSAWLSVVLTASGSVVGHDIGIEMDTPEDFIKDLVARGGTCETGAQFAWREIKRVLPNSRFVVILRDPIEVIKSLENCGLTGCDDEIYDRHLQLLEISKQPGVLTTRYEDLNNVDIVATIYKYCTDKEAPLVWISKMQDMVVKIDFQERLIRLKERQDKIIELKRFISDKSGYKIQVEPWSKQFWSDAKLAAEAHFEEVDGGVEPNRKLNLDEDMMAAMQNFGSLLILTARKDDELVGYFTWNITPDIESKGLLIAQQGAWFVFPGHPRIGSKLFDQSVKELRARGVQCIFPHHRVQGRGANLGRFFQKRGAKLIQHTYSLWIGEASA